MANLSGKRPRIGDIVEIATSKGFAYALYSHEHTKEPRMGSLLRVLPGFYAIRPKRFSELIEHREQFSVFFPLRAALRQGIVRIVGHEELPDWAARFPVFRSGLPDRHGKIHDWWLWDGENEWRVGALTPEMRSFPKRGIVNDTRLVEMIEGGYRPEEHV
jgi:hypothetical protein